MVPRRASREHHAPYVALQALAVILFVGIVAVDPDVFAFRPGATIRDVALLVLLPLVVLGSQLTIGHGPRMQPSLELDDEDRAIASRLADGRTYKEIGQELDMSPETVKVAVGDRSPCDRSTRAARSAG